MKIIRLLWLIGAMCMTGLAIAEEVPTLSRGQTLYLPIYSHVWHGDLDKAGVPLKSLVSALVSIRNTDMARSIRIMSARYYDTRGKLLNEYVSTPKTIAPMATYEMYVERKESAGGSGANFVISWQADAPANPPIVEALHADIQGHRTLSFITTARLLNTEDGLVNKP
ncbi:MAG: DUF3124 domain-containing protein [Sulfuricella sp.]